MKVQYLSYNYLISGDIQGSLTSMTEQMADIIEDNRDEFKAVKVNLEVLGAFAKLIGDKSSDFHFNTNSEIIMPTTDISDFIGRHINYLIQRIDEVIVCIIFDNLLCILGEFYSLLNIIFRK